MPTHGLLGFHHVTFEDGLGDTGMLTTQFIVGGEVLHILEAVAVYLFSQIVSQIDQPAVLGCGEDHIMEGFILRNNGLHPLSRKGSIEGFLRFDQAFLSVLVNAE